jgi:hypothetical protein
VDDDERTVRREAERQVVEERRPSVVGAVLGRNVEELLPREDVTTPDTVRQASRRLGRLRRRGR